jgi:hypothetical protein
VPRHAAALAACAVVVACAGCGDNGGSAATTSTRQETTKAAASSARAAYVRKADAFCARIRPEFAKVPQLTPAQARDISTAVPKAASFAALQRFAAGLGSVLRRHQHELDTIPRPDDPLVRRWYAAYRATVRAVEDLRLGASTHQTYELQTAVERNQAAGRRYQLLSQQLGFKVCGATA